MNTSLLVVLVLGALARVYIASHGMPVPSQDFQWRIELTSPSSAWPAVAECVYLSDAGLDPFAPSLPVGLKPSALSPSAGLASVLPGAPYGDNCSTSPLLLSIVRAALSIGVSGLGLSPWTVASVLVGGLDFTLVMVALSLTKRFFSSSAALPREITQRSLKSLGIPDELDKDTVDKLMTATDNYQEAVEKYRAAVKRGDKSLPKRPIPPVTTLPLKMAAHGLDVDPIQGAAIESFLPTVICAWLWLNPVSLAGFAARSLAPATSLAVYVAFASALSPPNRAIHGIKLYMKPMMAAALATHLSGVPLILVPALALVARLSSGARHSMKQSVVLAMQAYGIWMTVFSVLATFIMGGSWSWLWAQTGSLIAITNYTPNLGLAWYLFQEMFSVYRDFFLVIFQLHLVVYIVPVTLRLRHYPAAAVIVLLGISITFGVWPTGQEIVAWLGLVPLLYPLTPFTRYAWASGIIYAYMGPFAPVVWFQWIEAGVGNANFLQAACIGIGLANVWVITDIVWAITKREGRYLQYSMVKALRDGSLGKRNSRFASPPPEDDPNAGVALPSGLDTKKSTLAFVLLAGYLYYNVSALLGFA